MIGSTLPIPLPLTTRPPSSALLMGGGPAFNTFVNVNRKLPGVEYSSQFASKPKSMANEVITHIQREYSSATFGVDLSAIWYLAKSAEPDLALSLGKILTSTSEPEYDAAFAAAASCLRRFFFNRYLPFVTASSSKFLVFVDSTDPLKQTMVRDLTNNLSTARKLTGLLMALKTRLKKNDEGVMERVKGKDAGIDSEWRSFCVMVNLSKNVIFLHH
jgi:hypothetical protein